LTKYFSRLTPIASVALAVAVCAAPATAADDKRRAVEPRGTSVCEPELTSSGALFALDEEGYIADGYPAGFNEDEHDSTWDDAGELRYRIADDPEQDEDDFDYYDGDEEDCTLEEGGREVVYSDDPIDDDLVLTRQAYVPPTGGFARMLDTVTNEGTEPRTVDLAVFANHYSDDEAAIGGSSSGDLLATPGDFWFTQIDGDGNNPETDYFSGHGTFNFQSRGGVIDRADEVVRDLDEEVEDEDYRYVVFRDITVQPGQTVGYLTAFGQSAGVSGVNALAAEIGRGPATLFAGLEADELAALRNWQRDRDADGVLDDTDTCVDVANADQANLDGDGQGDACDDDVDGDGLPNGVESGFGSDPRNADSDGDGLRDGNDQCPSLGGTANGCPAANVSVLASTGRALPTSVSLNLSATKGKASASSRKARAAQAGGTLVRAGGRIGLPQGVPASACSLGRVAVLIKRGKQTISTRVVNVRPDCSYRSNVRFKRNLGSRVRAKSYFFGSTGLVGRAAKAKSAQVK
jgi:hypothetical protein